MPRSGGKNETVREGDVRRRAASLCSARSGAITSTVCHISLALTGGLYLYIYIIYIERDESRPNVGSPPHQSQHQINREHSRLYVLMCQFLTRLSADVLLFSRPLQTGVTVATAASLPSLFYHSSYPPASRQSPSLPRRVHACTWESCFTVIVFSMFMCVFMFVCVCV